MIFHRKSVWLTTGLAVFAFTVFVTVYWHTADWHPVGSHLQDEAREDGAHVKATPLEMLPQESPKPVGWVFGRVMGVPGAESPLMSTYGTPAGRRAMSPAPPTR